ncbi:MAG TPA: efflux RND transporter permease subunit [Kiritimatiellia bacterium]|nr:efflux RND transporter permease subunit [Kiritimatiellia bacterium]HMP00122.1 efflux RND transporter permease subunit [Kiritimatiellia bacterium]HMP96583.1 efflux RND transporter permease subunit [Kiritimatiellia bacterium]
MSRPPRQPEGIPESGPIAWMVRNRVTPNLVMLFLLIGGVFMLTQIKQEVFPEFSLDTVTITVPYRGASPEEVESGIVLALEEAVRGVEGIKQITSVAGEGFGRVVVELLSDTDQQKAYQDIQQEVDRITTLPLDAEDPQVVLDIRRRQVLDLQIYGDAEEWVLRQIAEEVRDRLLQQSGISQIELDGVRELELRIEVAPEMLRTYDLTLEQIAQLIRRTAIELPGGSVRTDSGEILVRFKERRNWASEFADLPVRITASGATVRLGDIAVVSDDFEEIHRYASFNGKPAIGFSVYRIGDQTPIGVSRAVRQAMEEIEPTLPAGVEYAINNDWSDIYRQRMQLLTKNAAIGLVLVLSLLGLFLEFKLAFWVTMGIPISFLGAIFFLPTLDVSINMISMFAFIIALGIVVDDAIVVGENVYEHRQRGDGLIGAAIRGTQQVSLPVTYSILTNIIAFMPLLFVPGMLGKTWSVIPYVVITVFVLSWFEALFILPAHLAHVASAPKTGFTARLHRRQQAFGSALTRFAEGPFARALDACIRWRYLTVAVGAALLLIILGWVASGRLGFILMPRVEADRAVVTATLPYGSPLSRLEDVRDRLVGAARVVVDANGGAELSRGIFAQVNDNIVEISVYLTPPQQRPISTTQLTQLWRSHVGVLPGVETLLFQADRGGPGSGAAITIELSHRDIPTLETASRVLAERLAVFPNLKDIDAGYTPGKRQFDFTLKPEGRSLGLSTEEVARQVRAAFFGAEALRQQRGRNEVRVMVKLPEDRRVREFDIENFLVRAPSGRDVPLLEIADVNQGRAYTSIQRREGRRTLRVSADVEPIGETGRVKQQIDETILPALAAEFPGLTYGYEGRQADMRDSLRALGAGFGLVLFFVYFLLAIPFRSYIQPIIVMLSIPFGIIGAVLGHLVMGYNLSVISIMGMIALAGVVVNGSLVLIDYANRRQREGASAFEAIHAAGVRRFRPILLTTLTTFGGLAPMIFETSRQARFMIPMALSLGYGILFSSLICLILVPSLYMIIEDFRSGATAPDREGPPTG